MVQMQAEHWKSPEGRLLHVGNLTVLVRSCGSARLQGRGRYPLETGRNREGQCLKQKDDYGKKAKSHESVYASSERANSPKSSSVKLEEYLFLKRDGIEEIS